MKRLIEHVTRILQWFLSNGQVCPRCGGDRVEVRVPYLVKLRPVISYVPQLVCLRCKG